MHVFYKLNPILKFHLSLCFIVYSHEKSLNCHLRQNSDTAILNQGRPKLKTNGHFTKYMKTRGYEGNHMGTLDIRTNSPRHIIPFNGNTIGKSILKLFQSHGHTGMSTECTE